MASQGERAVVLVVDDEPAIRLLCRVNLELDGYEVREAATLAEARRQLDGVGLVLLDMHVGRERGEVLLEEVAALGIPVVLVTGSTDVETVQRGRAAAVLGKPFTIDALREAVATLVSRGDATGG